MLMEPFYDRMPMILERNEYGPWLDPECEPETPQQFLNGYPTERMDVVPMSSYVSNTGTRGRNVFVRPQAERRAVGDVADGLRHPTGWCCT